MKKLENVGYEVAVRVNGEQIENSDYEIFEFLAESQCEWSDDVADTGCSFDFYQNGDSAMAFAQAIQELNSDFDGELSVDFYHIAVYSDGDIKYTKL